MTFVTPDPAPDAVRVLLSWAESVGYERVWLPDRLVALDPGALGLPAANITCPTCHATWTDNSPEFWTEVHRQGRFPTACPICAGDLPQWSIDGRRPSTANN